MTEVNFAEHDQKIRENPSLRQAYGQAQAHFGYGWSKRPWGHWSDRHKAEYDRGYEDAQRGVTDYPTEED